MVNQNKSNSGYLICPVCANDQAEWLSNRCMNCEYPLKSKPLQAAWRKGFLADTYAKCPYTEWRTSHNNGVTFSRSFIQSWRDGHIWRGLGFKALNISEKEMQERTDHTAPELKDAP